MLLERERKKERKKRERERERESGIHVLTNRHTELLVASTQTETKRKPTNITTNMRTLE